MRYSFDQPPRNQSPIRRPVIQLALPLLLIWATAGGQPGSTCCGDELAGADWADPAEYERRVVPFFQQHCVSCHGGEQQQADLRIDQLRPDFTTPQSAGHWVEVMDRLNLGEMPPEDQPQPEVDQLRTVTAWIAAELRNAERLRSGGGERIVLRRLNRAEYSNTIRDLLSLEFLPGESPLDFLPPDGTAEGFDKLSSALMLDPSLLEKYFDVAQQIADTAIVDGPPRFPTEVMRYELEETANNRAIRYLCAKPGITCREDAIVLMQGATRSFGVMKYPGTNAEIPAKGMYRVRVRAWAEDAVADQPVVMRFEQRHPREDQQRLLETEVTSEPQVYEVVVPRDPKCGEYAVSIVNGTGFETSSRAGLQLRDEQQQAGKAGQFERVMRLQSRQQMEALTWSRPHPDAADTKSLPKLVVDWIECEGPLYEQWPPKSHQTLLGGDQGSEDRKSIESIFDRFMRRAFRRPVTKDEVDAVVELVQSEIAAGESFRDGVRAGVVAILCSPKFLYLAEPNHDATPRALNDWELASRLSYFLWSSMPDEQLFALAEEGRLNETETLLEQVDRMLADPRSTGFVQGFGAQWLRTHEFRNFTPDARLYKDYDEELGKAMVGETLEFFAEVLRNDRSVLDFIDSDWTMVNQRLARFYGIEGVEGEAFRRVALPPDTRRGGLLGMAGVAMRGSDGNRTKPVHRGVYVREVFFNDPPDPPPPNVGEVEPNIEGENLTVRQRLIQHQKVESCAACHRGIDGYGLALENFNAIGAWRERQDGEGFRGRNAPAIDASGTLPGGKRFENFAEFKSLLMEQSPRFRRGLAEKMLTYALARPVLPSDRPLVDRLVQRMTAEDDTLRSLIRGVVTSDAFLTK